MTQDEANRIIEAARDRRDAMERAVARDDALKVAQDHAAEAEECAAVIQTALAEPAPAHEGWFAAKLAADRFPREVALATMWAKIAEALR